MSQDAETNTDNDIDILNNIIYDLNSELKLIKLENINMKKDEEITFNLLSQYEQELRISQEKLKDCQEKLEDSQPKLKQIKDIVNLNSSSNS